MKLIGITKHYGKTPALENLDLEIAEGEITAVLGASGAGKTTLLNVIARLTDFEGKIEESAEAQYARGGRKNCSYLFQSAKLLPNLTVEGNLKFVLPEHVWGDIPAILARVGLAGKEKRYPRELSGGEAQRVSIARAFLFPHDLLLMDEPFSSLDLGLKKSLISLVYELYAAQGGTIVFVTHDVHEAAMLARRAVVLGGGKVVGDVVLDEPYPRDFFAHSQAERALALMLAGENPS